MNRPKVHTDFIIGKLPVGASYRTGFLTETSAGMRTFRPVIDMEKCKNCFRCFLFCPDGAVDKSSGAPEIDYDYCKGCGICEKECPFDAIQMRKEEKSHV